MSTYEPIASQTLGDAASSVTFSSLPQNYTDLILVVNYGISANNFGLRIRFNGDTGSNYSDTGMYGSGSSPLSFRDTNATSILSSGTGLPNDALTANAIFNIQNYSNSATNKTVLIRGNVVTRETIALAGLWRNTTPITSIQMFVGSGNILTGSTFTIYGIAAGNSSAKASGGNIVTTDGSYWYHTFTSSGIFTPTQNISNVDYLVVAGGGGGSGANGGADAGNGGGGAGGLRSTVTATGGGGTVESKLTLTANTVYQAIVGAGGTGGTGGVGTRDGINGSNSVFSTITSTGGSGGNDYGGSATATGGSGGGAGAGAANSSLGTANQGYDGGTSSGNSGGGGGGAGAVGGTASGSTGGAGGTGVAVAISGSSITYAGGGGGGGKSTGGAGGSSIGGGGGSGNNNGAAGLVYSGSGGGGAGGVLPSGINTGGNGGSGIVIIRYAV